MIQQIEEIQGEMGWGDKKCDCLKYDNLLQIEPLEEMDPCSWPQVIGTKLVGLSWLGYVIRCCEQFAIER